jgi:hypothetical protein
MKNKGPVFAPEGEGTPAAVTPAPAADPAVEAADTSTILYGSDPAPSEPAPTEAAPADGWKEYEADPAKSDDENAAAKAEHDKGKPAEADAGDTVPEDGVYKLTLPDDMPVDDALLAAISPAMKEAGITGKQANTLAAAFAAQKKAEVEQWGQTVSGWVDSAKKDPEIGGANWDSTVKSATKVIGQFGTPELKEYLNMTGAGNHPEVIRLMAKVGAVISEDTPTATSKGGQARDAVTVLYPDDQPKG